MSETFKSIMEIGLATENEDKIKDFLERIYKIQFDNYPKWEKEITEFFKNEIIVPYVIVLSKEDDFYSIFESIKIDFLKSITSETIVIDTNKIYKDLVKIRESLIVGKDIRDYLNYFFNLNSYFRKIFTKVIDEEDSLYTDMGVNIQPTQKELFDKELNSVGFENLFFICPDSTIDYPIRRWSEEISKRFIEKIKSKLNYKKKKIKKRDPIETRLRHEVFKKDNYKCKECGKGKEETTLHCDHILPVAQGGTDELDNLQTLCQSCNFAKSNRKWVGGENDKHC